MSENRNNDKPNHLAEEAKDDEHPVNSFTNPAAILFKMGTVGLGDVGELIVDEYSSSSSSSSGRQEGGPDPDFKDDSSSESDTAKENSAGGKENEVAVAGGSAGAEESAAAKESAAAEESAGAGGSAGTGKDDESDREAPFNSFSDPYAMLFKMGTMSAMGDVGVLTVDEVSSSSSSSSSSSGGQEGGPGPNFKFDD